MTSTVYRIEEVSAQTGLTKRALRYYEDLELITPLRTESGYRVYSGDDIEKLQRIIEIKDALGIRLNDVKEILALESNLAQIIDSPAPTLALIGESLAMIEKQLRLVAEKERSLGRVARKYQKTHADLMQLSVKLKEGEI